MADALARRVFEFHKSRDGRVDRAELDKLLRCCGHAPTASEVAALANEHKVGLRLDEARFLAVERAARAGAAGHEREMVQALRIFGQLKGGQRGDWLPPQLLLEALQSGQDPLDAQEADKLMRDLGAVQTNGVGHVNIEDFCKKLLV